MFNFISRLIDDPDPVIIMPYGGYANDSKFFAQARVLEYEGIKHTEEDNFIKNLYNSYKRFESDEVQNAQVIVSTTKEIAALVSDNEGYIYLEHEHFLNLETTPYTQFLHLDYKLMVDGNVEYSIKDFIMYPSKQASFGVISDMDDTVLDTGLSSRFKYKVILNSFFKHHSKRMPLEGALEFYNLLQKGRDGKKDNPFFYLSNSPWNLFEYLSDFLKHQGFPRGVLLLRDIGFENEKKPSFLDQNKFLKISHIISTYPNMNFILIGDAADLDHEIYIAIARKFPERILAIYIRTVSNVKKMVAVKKLIELTTDVDVVLIENSAKAIAHARQLKLIV